MLSLNLRQKIRDDAIFKDFKLSDFILPTYIPESHYLELTKSGDIFMLLLFCGII